MASLSRKVSVPRYAAAVAKRLKLLQNSPGKIPLLPTIKIVTVDVRTCPSPNFTTFDFDYLPGLILANPNIKFAVTGRKAPYFDRSKLNKTANSARASNSKGAAQPAEELDAINAPENSNQVEALETGDSYEVPINSSDKVRSSKLTMTVEFYDDIPEKKLSIHDQTPQELIEWILEPTSS